MPVGEGKGDYVGIEVLSDGHIEVLFCLFFIKMSFLRKI